ncbi:hypothetical protein FPV16_24655 [Methylobacterium sp. W2]|uniref:calcium-binding protein n=1 Tax=Methylobacterium sp. W2 TaxID=2598107 RepID=UPI001D0C4563|nr:hypothetical protein [Methylobacterium sp. W2]MCC0809349.1 hypothetical protein [Methylobacterium sp. W2]
MVALKATIGGDYDSNSSTDLYFYFTPGDDTDLFGFSPASETIFAEDTDGMLFYESSPNGSTAASSIGGTNFILSPDNAGYFVNFTGHVGLSYLSGGDFGDHFIAGIGDDTLKGEAGDDVLEGGAGADILNGGTGNNTASYQHSLVGVVADLSGLLTQTGDAIGDTFIDIQNLIGTTFDDILVGNVTDNVLDGGAGDDILEGGLGSNIISGGSGQNTVSYQNIHFSLNAGVNINLSIGHAADLYDGVQISDTLIDIQNAVGSVGDDNLQGSAANNILQGGAGADLINGNGGVDTASYSLSASGVQVNLASHYGAGGDAEGDTLYNIENLLGSTFADTLTGDALSNTLTGFGGGDALYGMGGNDRLVISDTPTMIDGGDGKDLLFVTGGGIVSLTEATFTGIEKVYVRNDATLDMSDVRAGVTIVSQSTDQHFVDVTGTLGDDTISAGKGFDQIHGGAGDDVIKGGNGIGPAGASVLYGDAGNDVITAGKGIALIYGGDGNDTLKGASGVGLLSGGDGNDRIIAGARGFDIDGGEGTDRLFAGAGDDTFHFAGNFGRDEIYKFDLAHETLDVSAFATDFNGLKISSVHNGADTQITFVGDADPTHKIILHDVTKADLIDQGHFTFGA